MSIATKVAVVREANGPFLFENISLTDPQNDEVLVRIEGCGICHTDLACRAQVLPSPFPIVFGHEGAGIVEAVGDGVTDLTPGDQVVLTFDSCGVCPACVDGAVANCHQLVPMNLGHASTADGERGLVYTGFFNQSSFATYAKSKRSNAVKIETSAPLEIFGPLGCGLQTGAGAIMNSLNVVAGARVLIIGGGPVGLAGVMAAKASGASKIVLIEPISSRRSLARELGVTDAFDADDAMERLADYEGGFTDALDTSGRPDAIELALSVLAPRGKLALTALALAGANVSFDQTDFMLRGLKIMGVVEGDSRPHEFIPKLVELHANGEFPFEKLVTKFAFESLNEAIEAFVQGNVVKPIITF